MDSVVSKSDIEALTKQVSNDKINIWNVIYREHNEIDPSLLCDRLNEEYTAKINKINESHLSDNQDDDQIISLDDFEFYFSKLDEIDKKLHGVDPKTTNAAAIPAQRKETQTTKRMGSMTDLNKSLWKSSSLLNLTTATKTFAEPMAPPLKTLSKPKIDEKKSTADDQKVHKISAEQLAEFNAIKLKIHKQLEDNELNEKREDAMLNSIRSKISISVERLKSFFEEFDKLKSFQNAENCENTALHHLDDELLEMLKKFSEVIYHKFLFN